MDDTGRRSAPDWELEDVPCDLCGAADAEPILRCPDRILHRPVTFAVVRCRRCGLARINPRPTRTSLTAAYVATHEPPTALEKGFRAPRGLFRWALVNYRRYPLGGKAPAWLRAALRPVASLVLRGRKGQVYLPYRGAGRLLDFGCGAGKFVARMAAAGWQAEGLDLSPDAIRAGREAGLALRLGTLPGADLPPGSFDCITMWHSLEHVPSPMATLRAARQLLQPGGTLLVSVPRLDSLVARWTGSAWYGLGVPLHLTQFTRDTLARCLEAAGFRTLRFHHASRASWLRLSCGYVADDTGRQVYRRLSRSRFVPGLLAAAAKVARRSQQLGVLAQAEDQS